MLALGPTDSVNAGATSASVVNCVIEGQVITAGSPPTSASFGVLYAGQLAASVTQLYSPGAGTEALISRIALFNTSASVAQTVTWAENGTTAPHYTATIQLVAAGWAEYEPGSGWTMYSAHGTVVEGITEIESTDGSITVTNPTGPTVNIGSSGQTFPIFIYGDGSDGPLLFTATPRTVTDAVTTPGSDIITSETADFTDADIGLGIDDGSNTSGQAAGNSSIPAGATIRSVTSPTEAVMTRRANANATGTASNTVKIGSTRIWPGNYSSITIPTGVTVRPGTGWNLENTEPVFGAPLCAGEYYIDGAIDLTGADGGPGGTGDPGPGPNASYWPPYGGTGGAGSTETTGDTLGGSAQAQNIAANYARNVFAAANLELVLNDTYTNQQGGGGGGDGTNNGGGGGNNGIPWAIFAKSVVHGPNASYILTGGTGGDGAPGADVAATLLSDSAPTLPLTIATGVNDEMTYTGDGGQGSPETFTFAAATLTTIDEVVAAVGAAIGSVSGEAFSTIATPSNSGGRILLTMNDNGPQENDNSITPGTNDVTADLGFAGYQFFNGGDKPGNCGGGGGGADGWWITTSDTLTGAPSIVGGGGPGGAGSGTGTDGTAGEPGFGVHYTPGSVVIQTP